MAFRYDDSLRVFTLPRVILESKDENVRDSVLRSDSFMLFSPLLIQLSLFVFICHSPYTFVISHTCEVLYLHGLNDINIISSSYFPNRVILSAAMVYDDTNFITLFDGKITSIIASNIIVCIFVNSTRNFFSYA